MICRVLPHETADGPANMALDEALLDAVAEDPAAAVFRTYGWTAPTLSLGYFQSHAEAETDGRWRDAAMVRRPTGGGALWHHHELTYAVVVPRDHPSAHPSRALYRAVHDAIAQALRSEGMPARRRGDDEPRHAERCFLCFTDHDPEDIVSSGVKIVGSAQRRRSGAVLQHGALLLARSPVTPELPGAADLSRLPPDPMFWSTLLQIRIPETLGLVSTSSELSAQERLRARVLEEEVYRNPSWTRRR